ncbi:MAG: dTDP-4-dehydrorhamnose 3,5-epimerase family protein [Longimicrobiaceae bacterium]
MSKQELTPETLDSLTFEEYGSGPGIEGAWRRPLRKHRSENGWFLELYRLDAGRVEGPEGERVTLRQLSVSYADPGRVNAFHIHPNQPQNEAWTVVRGQLLVWLVDCRASSASAGVQQRVVLSAEEPELLHIPAGVAHGYRAGSEGALLVYGMDQQFDPRSPNEGRLAWDHFGAGLWEKDRG